jgi:hypothetical protein
MKIIFMNLKHLRHYYNFGESIKSISHKTNMKKINKKLMKASRKGKLKKVKFLVEKGADIHALEGEALQVACQNGHLEVVKFLESI